MADLDSTFFTDEEIYKELENLGITDVSSETFEKMKQDLLSMVSSERSDLDNSPREIKNSANPDLDNISFNSLKRSLFQDPSPNANYYAKSYEAGIRSKSTPAKNYRSKSSQKYSSSTDDSISTNDLLLEARNLPSIYENYDTYQTGFKSNGESEGERLSSSSRFLASEKEKLDFRYKALASQEDRSRDSSLPLLSDCSQTNKVPVINSASSKANERLPDVQKSSDISSDIDSDSPKTNSLLGDYRKRLINYKIGNRLRQRIAKDSSDSSELDKSSNNEVSLNSTVVDGKIKRKVLRHKDGKPVITEEFVDIPNIFTSCYPSSLTTTNSFSSDLSLKSNSSTGSLVVVSPESTPRSTLSNASRISVSKQPRKKKSDPVAMYNYYKKFWDNFKPPGEKSHQKLRWAVRDKLMDYSL